MLLLLLLLEWRRRGRRRRGRWRLAVVVMKNDAGVGVVVWQHRCRWCRWFGGGGGGVAVAEEAHFDGSSRSPRTALGPRYVGLFEDARCHGVDAVDDDALAEGAAVVCREPGREAGRVEDVAAVGKCGGAAVREIV